MKYILFFFIIISSICFTACNSQKKETHKIIRTTISMGSPLEIQIICADSVKALKAIDEVFEELQRINDKYSTFVTNNFMSEMNKPSDTFKLDAETYYLLKQCDFAYKKTNRAFDAALGNLIKLAGFESGNPTLPSKVDISKALEQTGWKYVNIQNPLYLIRTKPVTINFGGIGDGYSIDRASRILRTRGIDTFLVNAGGEVRAEGKEWNIGIQHPRKANSFLGVLRLKNKSVSTSGDYEKYFQKNGKRFSHIIDPRTGEPCDNCQAVTVIADKGIRTDALATGLFVLGQNEGMEAIKKIKGVECLIVSTNGEIKMTKGFSKYLLKVKSTD